MKNSTVFSFCLGMLPCLCIPSHGLGAQAENPRDAARAPLGKCVEAQSILDRASWDIDVTSDYPAVGKIKSPRSERYEIQATRDTDRVAMRGRLLLPGERKAQSYQFKIVSNADYFVYCQYGLDEQRPESAITAKKTKPHYTEKFTLAPQHGGPLDGRLVYFGGRRVAEELLTAEDLRVRGREKIGDVDCLVIEGRTRNGRATAWLAPGMGHSLMKFLLERAGDEITRNMPDPLKADLFRRADQAGKPRPVMKMIDELDRVRVEVLDGHFIPVEGVHIVKTFMDGEFSSEERDTYKRSHVRLGPPSDEAEAFKVDLKEHAVVTFLDVPKSGIVYEWANGNISPVKDHESGVVEEPFKPGGSRVWTLVFLNLSILAVVGICFYARTRIRNRGGSA